MQQYYISRNGTQEGPHHVSVLLNWIRDGQLPPTTLAWQEGMANWLPLSQIPALASPVISNPYQASPVSPAFGQPTAYGMPQRTPGSAVVSLVFGILGILFLVLFFILSPIFGLVAVICGHVSMGGIKRAGGQLGGRGMALAGVIMGYLSIFIAIIIGIFAFVLVKEVLEQNGTKTPEELLEKLKKDSRTGL
jgi:hypothetical protein